METVKLLKKVLDYIIKGDITQNDLEELIMQADRRSIGDRHRGSTCHVVLGAHRGYEGEYNMMKNMAALELGLKDPNRWNDSDWEKFNHWQNVFHATDVVSGPHCTEIAEEKYQRGQESAKWLKEHIGA